MHVIAAQRCPGSLGRLASPYLETAITGTELSAAPTPEPCVSSSEDLPRTSKASKPTDQNGFIKRNHTGNHCDGTDNHSLDHLLFFPNSSEEKADQKAQFINPIKRVLIPALGWINVALLSLFILTCPPNQKNRLSKPWQRRRADAFVL